MQTTSRQLKPRAARTTFFASLVLAISAAAAGHGVIDHGNDQYSQVKSNRGNRGLFLNQRQKRKKLRQNPHLRNK